ncbi:MAG TPA: CAP domain-containing protein [Propionibacteriaceae bacterium]|nr:CAP domain-containing protein [Propionibacteriaceae bacterium]
MASHWSVPHVVAVSVVLAVAILEGGAAFRAAQGESALTSTSGSVGVTAIASTDGPSAAQTPDASLAATSDPSAAQEPPAATGSAHTAKASKPNSSPTTAGTVTPRQDLAEDVAAAANAERQAAGLRPLTYSSCTVPAAWAVHLATVTTLTHNSLTSVLATCGGTTKVGENIAVAYTTVADVTAGWMNSPGHQANILNPAFTTISVGVAQAADGTYYWVEDFTG